MPRQPRLDAPGFIYHIIARGIERRAIFADELDSKAFIDRLSAILIDTGTPIYAFSLIPNHFHLLIRRTKQPASTVMSRLLTSYALYFNKRHKRAGHLFQNRYKAIICQEDSYLFELIRYINLNPVRAKLVKTIDDLSSYPFSSHPYMIGKKTANWFDGATQLAYFSQSRKVAIKRYLNFLKDGLSLREDFDGGGLSRSLQLSNYPREKQVFDDRVLGDGDFVEAVLGDLQKKEKSKAQEEVGVIIYAVCGKYNITEIELKKRTKRPEVVKARSELVFRLSRETILNYSQIAARLELTRSAVSKIMTKHRKVT